MSVSVKLFQVKIISLRFYFADMSGEKYMGRNIYIKIEKAKRQHAIETW